MWHLRLALGSVMIMLVVAFLFLGPAHSVDVEGRAQADRALQASVVLSQFTDRAPGCGGVIASTRAVITAYHCVRSATFVWARTYAGNPIRMRVARIEPTYDLAVLVSEVDLVGRVPQLAPDVAVGDRVLVVGAPDTEAFMVTFGIVSRIETTRFSNCPGTIEAKLNLGTSPQQQLTITAPVFFGNSGGGAFNLDGQLVGVIVRMVSARPGNCDDATPYAGQHILWGLAVGADTIREKVR